MIYERKYLKSNLTILDDDCTKITYNKQNIITIYTNEIIHPMVHKETLKELAYTAI